MFGSFWRSLSLAKRLSLVFGVAAITGLGVWLYLSLTAQDFQVLYSDLQPQEASQVVKALNGMKIPYHLEKSGSVILVPKDKINDARLQLAGAGLPASSGVGFELFDKSDYGMTEFAQKINFQRALQGELARTIMTLDEVKFARVHLVMPDTSLFKKDKRPPKASVTLIAKPNKKFNASEISGIQRLVATAVEGLSPSDVTVLNHKGVVLSQSGSGVPGDLPARLAQKRDMESYLKKKVNDVLLEVFGGAKAFSQVDVSLDYDQVESKRDELLPVDGRTQKGAISRHSLDQHIEADSSEAAKHGHGKVLSESANDEYVYGHEIKNTIQAPGNIERLTVSVVVPKSATETQIALLKKLVSAAIGIDTARGDRIEIAALADPGASQDIRADVIAAKLKSRLSTQPPASTIAERGREALTNTPINKWTVFLAHVKPSWVIVSMVVLFLLGMLFSGLFLRRKSALKPAEREAVLRDIRSWINVSE